MEPRWAKRLSQFEIRAFVGYVLDAKNMCRVVKEESDPEYMDEGLRQTLYVCPPTNDCVFVVRQKGYIVNALYVKKNEVEEFLEYWEDERLSPYGEVLPEKRNIQA